MNAVGPLIEKRRRELGLSRSVVAERLGVTEQTLLNVERAANYNVGTEMLRRLEAVLDADFNMSLVPRRKTMSTIQFGNDEAILHIRKTHPKCSLTTDAIGKRVWQFLRAQPGANARKVVEDEPCMWGANASNIDEMKLPKTAAQFVFERPVLPDLFDFLDRLGSE
jgi:transcriptional regulator with XRE-family HTH domain